MARDQRLYGFIFKTYFSRLTRFAPTPSPRFLADTLNNFTECVGPNLYMEVRNNRVPHLKGHNSLDIARICSWRIQQKRRSDPRITEGILWICQRLVSARTGRKTRQAVRQRQDRSLHIAVSGTTLLGEGPKRCVSCAFDEANSR